MAPPMPRENLLVVCRANAARSPLVAGLLRRRLDEIGRQDLLVESAGLSATPRLPATDETLQVARRLGIDLESHRAARLTETMLARAALVLTMTETQRSDVERIATDAVTRTFTQPELVRLLESRPGRVSTWSEMAARAHLARPLTAPAASAEDLADPVGQSWRHYQSLADRLANLCDVIVGHVDGHATSRDE